MIVFRDFYMYLAFYPRGRGFCQMGACCGAGALVVDYGFRSSSILDLPIFQAHTERAKNLYPARTWSSSQSFYCPFCPNPRSIMTTRVFTTTQIFLSRLSRNELTSLCCLYHRGYKIVYLEVVVLQSVECSIANVFAQGKMGHFFPSPLAQVP